MNLKDKLVSKLLNVGKKHRILVYPMLALVAVITAISHAVCWGKGNGKKMVASILVVTLLITQSLFLTSSADYSGTDVNTPTDASYSQDGNEEDLLDGTNQIDMEDFSDNQMMSGDSQIQVLDNGAGDSTAQNSIYVTYKVDYTGGSQQAVNPIQTSVGAGADGKYILPSLTDTEILGMLNFNESYVRIDGIYDSSHNELTRGTSEIPAKYAGKTYEVSVKITRLKYKVQYVDASDTTHVFTTKEYSIDNPASGDFDAYGRVIEVPSAASADYPFYKYGYKYTSLNGSSLSSNTTTVNTYVPFQTDTLTVQVGWTPVSDLKLTYKICEDDMTDTLQVKDTAPAISETTFTYGSEVTISGLAGNESDYIANDAYCFTGWKIVGGDSNGNEIIPGTSVKNATLEYGTKIVQTNGDKSNDPNVIGVTLVGQWEQRTLRMKLGDGTYVSTNQSEPTVISGEYETALTCEMTIVYNGNGEAVDNCRILREGSWPDGLLYEGRANTIKISGTPKSVSTGGTYKFTIEDNVNNITQNFYVQFVIEPKTIKLSTLTSSTGAGLTRYYDGTSNVDVKSPIAVVDKDGNPITDTDGNPVDVSVTFTSASLVNEAHNQDPNVGEKIVYLTGVQLHIPSGKDNCYKLETPITDGGNMYVTGVAEITKRPLKYTITYPDDPSVKFGMDNPKPTLELQNPGDLKDQASINAYNSTEDHKAFWDQIGVDISNWTSDRTPYSPVGTYSVRPFIDTDKQCNYEIYNNDPQGNFAVTRDAITPSMYSIPEKDENKTVIYDGMEYYPSYTIVPNGTDGYTKVRIVSDGETKGSDLTPDMNRETVEREEFLSTGRIEKDVMCDSEHPIQFQFLNPDTHAVSEIYTITGPFRIDASGPEYVCHTIEETGPVYQFGFGTYSASNMRLKIVYSDNQSGCTKMHYYFADENGVAKEGMEVIKDMTLSQTMGSDDQICYEADIPVQDDSYYGQIVVWVEDAMGHTSDKIRLIKDTSDTPNGYYEWMVENNGPVADELVVRGNGETAYTGNWYNSLEASIVAKDSDSGLMDATWTIVMPDNTTKEVVTAVNGENATLDVKEHNNTFIYAISGTEGEIFAPGAYSFSAIVRDNAGNQVEVAPKGPFNYDGKAPALTVSDDTNNSNTFRQNVEITMRVSESENESGIEKICIYKDAEGGEQISSWSVAANQNRSWTGSYTIDKKGKYVIVATDKAGNKAVQEVDYNKISDVKPDTPVIEITKGDRGEIGDTGWYIQDKPKVTIKSTAQTSDQVPVTTYYKVIYKDATGAHEAESSFTTADHTFNLDGQGEVMIEAWAISESGCSSVTVSQVANVDVDAPVVVIKNSFADVSGIVTVNFQVTDSVSGVDTENVLVNGSKVSVKEKDGVVTGSFRADKSTEYRIVAYDKAGNASTPVLFAPLQLKVMPVTAITKTSAHMDVFVLQGSNPIGTCYVEYKKQNQSGYDTLLVNQDETDTGLSMSCDFKRLSEDTVYDYRVYASTENGGEERIVSGSFRTLSDNPSTMIYGNATYEPSLPDAVKEKPIYVNLYSGNTVIAGEIVTSADEPQYTFSGVEDGTFRIIATNGMMSKETLVTVEGGIVTDPDTYSTSGGINFELSGLSTSVVLDDGNIPIAVDGLDKIYDNAYYKGNVTDDDLRIVEAGGRIDICLHASYTKVNDLTETEKGIFVDRLGSHAEVLRYINLYIEKSVYDADGSLEYTQNLPRLYEPVRVSFPLGELAGQSIHVASLHGSGNNYDFKNWSDASEVTLTHDYVVITTDRFSTYALYRVLNPSTYTVVWKDGDGKVMKTETVEEGSSATPPTATPTKAATSKYRYKFEGWDQDYSNVTKDMVILAWFSAEKIDNNNSGGNNGNNGGSGNNNSGGVKPGDSTGNNSGTNAQETSKQPNRYTYFGSTGSPQTGDATPIVLFAVMLVITGTGIVILLKKKKTVSKN